jgi:hypothetical protein
MYLSAAGFLILLAACSKNTSTPGSGQSTSTPAQLAGNYTFLYIDASTNVTEQVSIAGQTAKFVTISNYRTVQNTGTVAFTTDSAFATGLGYTISTTLTAIQYQNGIAIDTVTQPYVQTIPATSSASKYQQIGTDSLYFPGGALGVGSLTAGTPIVPPTGGHFLIKGDTLTITTKINQTYPDNISGIPTTATALANATIVLLKQ